MFGSAHAGPNRDGCSRTGRSGIRPDVHHGYPPATELALSLSQVLHKRGRACCPLHSVGSSRKA